MFAVLFISSATLFVYGAAAVVAVENPPEDVETKVVEDSDSGEYHAFYRAENRDGGGPWMSAGTFQNESAAEDAAKDARERALNGPVWWQELLALLTPVTGTVTFLAYRGMNSDADGGEEVGDA